MLPLLCFACSGRPLTQGDIRLGLIPALHRLLPISQLADIGVRLLAPSHALGLQDKRKRQGDRHKPDTQRKSTKRASESTGGRPASHSGRYKRGSRKQSWAKALHVQCAASTPQVKELAEELAWERARRISLEGSEQAEKHMREQLRKARATVHRLRAKQALPGPVAKGLLDSLMPFP